MKRIELLSQAFGFAGLTQDNPKPNLAIVSGCPSIGLFLTACGISAHSVTQEEIDEAYERYMAQCRLENKKNMVVGMPTDKVIEHLRGILNKMQGSCDFLFSDRYAIKKAIELLEGGDV